MVNLLLKNKSKARNIIPKEYEGGLLESEYKKKILKITKSKHCSQEEFNKLVK